MLLGSGDQSKSNVLFYKDKVQVCFKINVIKVTHTCSPCKAQFPLTHSVLLKDTGLLSD